MPVIGCGKILGEDIILYSDGTMCRAEMKCGDYSKYDHTLHLCKECAKKEIPLLPEK